MNFPNRYLLITLFLVSSLLFTIACSEDGDYAGNVKQRSDIKVVFSDKSADSVTHRDGVTVTIHMAIPSNNARLYGGSEYDTVSSAARYQVSSITSMSVSVKQGSTDRVVDQPFIQTNGVWTGTLVDLPIGLELTFIARAYDNSPTPVEIFTGTTTQTLLSDGDSVSVILESTDATIARNLPKVEQISRPPDVGSNVSGQIDFYVSASFGETLTWEITSSEGSFDPSIGTIELAGSLGKISSQFTAPAALGTYAHIIKVTNSEGNSIKAVFDTTISDTWSTIQSDVFGPCVVCHNNLSDASGNNGLSFDADQYSALVVNTKLSSYRGYAYIDMSKTALSYLVLKLEAGGGNHNVGQADIDRLTSWIANKAPDATGNKTMSATYPVGSWMYVQKEAFVVCTVCHTSNPSSFPLTIADGNWDRAGDTYSSAPKGIEFDADNYNGIVDNSTIRPNNLSGSKAWERVNESQDRRMPLGMPPLTAAQKLIMKNWINSGAPKRP